MDKGLQRLALHEPLLPSDGEKQSQHERVLQHDNSADVHTQRSDGDGLTLRMQEGKSRA